MRVVPFAVLLSVAACASGSTSPDDAELEASRNDALLRAIIRDQELTGRPGAHVAQPAPALVRLGAALFFDKILGGERNQACASCHHPYTATGDDLRLGRGVGSTGVGAERERGPGPLIPRNAPPSWNAILFDVQFWDGRVTRDASGVIHSPDGITSDVTTALAAQAEFPVTSVAEMRGTFMPTATNAELRAALAARVADIAAYRSWFTRVFGDGAVNYTRIATALAAYETSQLPLDTPWFAYVRGDRSAISTAAKRGAVVFYGDGKCGTCHRGDLMTDQAFHDLAIPQFGPGKGDGADGADDYGRGRVTGAATDRYKFRTPTLINVDLHAPYGHDGAYRTLEGIVRHHLDPAHAAASYANDHGTLESVFRASLRDPAPALANLDPALATPIALSARQLSDLLAFLATLTDESAVDMAIDSMPSSVPSGLPIDR